MKGKVKAISQWAFGVEFCYRYRHLIVSSCSDLATITASLSTNMYRDIAFTARLIVSLFAYRLISLSNSSSEAR